ncbi:putative peptidoglycan linked protein [Listeria floridensis FSL S10-1187]|uniref:Peptidoglycan linked protein n=1 Tax=Listeria floridensis FSL S10-1187 TaxID=1265817 RepID=A0ABN0REM3_9LIST|nr:immunoglobulin-like domain-containing protein [Listeria floridensis]EUJ31254.1 putative peptidoglycan linked protein [Listeria floridensis FSL S10-1187]
MNKKTNMKIAKVGLATLIVGNSFTIPAFNVLADPVEAKSDVKSKTAAARAANVVQLVNGDFEQPLLVGKTMDFINASSVPGWNTTATDNMIEIQANGQGGKTAASGRQWAELNANQISALYQDIQTTPGQVIRWQVYHRGRIGTDSAIVEFGAPGGQLIQQALMQTNSVAWKKYSGTYVIPAGQTTTRFQFRGVTGQSTTEGNFLDNVIFSSKAEIELSGGFRTNPIYLNDQVDYDLRLTNTGGMTAADNNVTVNLPAETAYIPGSIVSSNGTVSNPIYNPASNTLTFTVDRVSTSSPVDVSFRLSGTAPGVNLSSSAQANYHDEGFTDLTYTSNGINSPITILGGSSPTIAGDDMRIRVGTSFDPMSGMSANDNEDGNLTSQLVVVNNPVNNMVPGTYTVTYQVTDSHNNTTTYTRQVIVESDNPPTITGEAETRLNPNDNFNPRSTMAASDAEDGDLTSAIVITSNNVNTAVPGTYQVEYEVTDSTGNKAQFTRKVIVTNPPVITGQQTVYLRVNELFNGLSTVTASDVEDGNLTSAIQIQSSNVDVTMAGTYNVIYSVRDSDGNTSTFIQTVVVTEAPIITGDKETRLNVGASFDPMSTMQAMDKEDGNITNKLEVTSNNVNTAVPGTYQVAYQVKDSDGNVATFVRVVVVTEKPVITGPTMTQINVGGTFDPLSDMKANDKEDGDLTSKLQVVSNNVNTAVAGTYKVEYSVVDSDGNTATYSRTVVVTEAPVITGEAETRLNQGQAFDPMSTMKAMDKEDGDLTAQLEVTKNTVNINVPGTYEVEYKVSDSDGNVGTFTRKVIVTEKPVITGEVITNLQLNEAFDPMSTMKATDKEDGDITNKLQILSNNVNTAVVGEYQVVYQVTDSDGNKATFTREVNVFGGPKITGEATTRLNPGQAFDPMSTMKAEDKEDGDLTAQLKVTKNTVNVNVPGDYEVAYEVTDSDGNKSTFTRLVTVTEKPVITGEQVIYGKVNELVDGKASLRATDKEDGDITNKIELVSTNVNIAVPGTYTNEFSVTDSDGNKAYFTQTVIITDGPQITGEKTTRLNPNAVFDPLSTMKASDTEDGDITSSIRVVSNNVNTAIPGTYQVSYEVSDSDGNKATFIRDVIVTEAPTITGEKTITLNIGQAFDPMMQITAADKEDGNLTSALKVVSNNVDVNTAGSYKVTYEVTDSDGNKATFTRDVIVTEAPVITGEKITYLQPNASFDPLSTMKAMDKEDGDLTAKLQVVKNNVDTKTPGTYEVTYEVTDSDGNKANFVRTVVVAEGPEITGEVSTRLNPNASFDPLSTMKAMDKEDGDITAKLVVTKNTVDTKMPGTYEVNYEVTDSDGNKATFIREVIVTEAPTITGEKTTRLNPNAAFDPLSTMKAVDKEDGDLTAKLVVLTNNVDTSVPGNYQVTYQVTDADGNKASFTRTVVVTEAPVITGEKTTRLNPNADFDPLSTMKAVDKEDGDLTAKLVVLTNNVDTSVPGNYQVTYQVTDADGNKASFTRTVVVTEAPVITGEASTRLNPNADFDPLSTMKAVDKEDGDLTSKLVVVNNPVDTAIPGTYQVDYQVTDADGNEAVFTREVIVTEAPTIKGELVTRLNPGQAFDPMSTMEAMDKEDGDLTAKLEVVNNPVDSLVPGTCFVTYQVTDADGNKATFTREVIVTEAPVITGEESTRLNPNADFDPMSTMKAADKEDGDLTAKLIVLTNTVDTSIPGTYEVTYQVTDVDGNVALFTREVVVTEAPTITGEESTRLNPNADFDPLSTMKATDKEDGDITDKLVVLENPVDTSKPGTYYVTYEVLDKDGNKATFTREVIVTEGPKITGEKETTLTVGDSFDPMSTIKASDLEDGDLTGDVKIIENTVDLTKAGTYKVVYEVTDSDGNKATFERVVIVKALPVTVDKPEQPQKEVAQSEAPKQEQSKQNLPETGDESNSLYPFAGLLLALAGIRRLFSRKKRKLNGK